MRFADGEVQIHYLLSRPSLPLPSVANRADSKAQSRRRSRASSSLTGHGALSFSSTPGSNGSSSISSLEDDTPHTGLQPDPAFPLLVLLPSEGYSCLHLFAEQLRDADLVGAFNIVVMDLRGHGLAKEVSSTSTLSNFLAFYLRLLCASISATPVEQVPICKRSGGEYNVDIKAIDAIEAIDALTAKVPDSNGKWSESILGQRPCALRIAAKRPIFISTIPVCGHRVAIVDHLRVVG